MNVISQLSVGKQQGFWGLVAAPTFGQTKGCNGFSSLVKVYHGELPSTLFDKDCGPP